MRATGSALAAFLLAVPLSAAYADDCDPLRDDDDDRVGLICDRENADDSVIVLIAGLGGAKTWAKLRPHAIADDDLRNYDLFEYHTPPSMEVDEHFEYVSGVVNEKWPDVENLVIVGHSIGGIVVRTLAIDGGANRLFPTEPRYVITFATPFEEGRFHRTFVQSLGTWFGYLVGAVQPLHKEAFDEERMAKYTEQWRQNVAGNEESISKTYLAVYGDSDKTAPADNERDKPFVVVIEGTHRSLIQPTKDNTCPYQVLKHMIVDGQRGPDECLVD